MIDAPSDLAQKITEDLKGPGPVDDGQTDVFGDEDDRPPVLARMSFTWRGEDKMVLDRVKAKAAHIFSELFTGVIDEVDALYMRMRVPVTNEHGQLRTDPLTGRPLWVLDEAGFPIERVDQLTGQDIDTVTLRLQHLLLEIVPRVNELSLDAIYAQHYVARDSFDDAWDAAKGATQADRRAKANKVSRDDRYAAYYRYYVYSTAKVFLDETNNFLRRLDKIRYRQLAETPR